MIYIQLTKLTKEKTVTIHNKINKRENIDDSSMNIRICL